VLYPFYAYGIAASIDMLRAYFYYIIIGYWRGKFKSEEVMYSDDDFYQPPSAMSS